MIIGLGVGIGEGSIYYGTSGIKDGYEYLFHRYITVKEIFYADIDGTYNVTLTNGDTIQVFLDCRLQIFSRKEEG